MAPMRRNYYPKYTNDQNLPTTGGGLISCNKMTPKTARHSQKI